jgi:hypothetical protein
VDFDNGMAGPHATAHGWIGGTLSDPHTSFRDPIVFLLHSNVDRLFAMWQTQPGHPERLDSQQVYAAYSSTQGSGDVNTLHPNWGILSPLEPWAAPGAQTAATGIIANVHATRPWAAPEHQELIKDSKDISVVAAPCYDTLPTTVRVIVSENPGNLILFNDVPQSETAARAAVFEIFACSDITLDIKPGFGPNAPYSLLMPPGTVTVPHGAHLLSKPAVRRLRDHRPHGDRGAGHRASRRQHRAAGLVPAVRRRHRSCAIDRSLDSSHMIGRR